MSRTIHPQLQKFNGNLGGMSTRDLDRSVSREEADAMAQAGAERARAAVAAQSTRSAHPVVPAPDWKCYRVMRFYKENGTVQCEPLGGFKSVTPALALMNREIGKARVLDLNNKVYADNWQPMEDR